MSFLATSFISRSTCGQSVEEVTPSAFENVVSKDKKAITNVYTELQKIDEFEADFKPTEQSKRRKQELLEEIRKENIYEELRQIDEFEANFKPNEQSKNTK